MGGIERDGGWTTPSVRWERWDGGTLKANEDSVKEEEGTHGEERRTLCKDARCSLVRQRYKAGDPVGQETFALGSGGTVAVQRCGSGMLRSS